MSIAESHVWKALKRGPRDNQVCFFCHLIIRKKDPLHREISSKIMKYDQPYSSTKYAHEKCLKKARRKDADQI